MTIYSKREAIERATADYLAGRYGRHAGSGDSQDGYVYEVWGGDTGYRATERGVERYMRNDDGGTRGLVRPDVLVRSAGQIGGAR